jgi:hypothetical protein
VLTRGDAAKPSKSKCSLRGKPMFRDNGQGIFSQCLCLPANGSSATGQESPPSHQGCVDLRSLFGSSLTASRDGAPPIDSSAAGDLCFLFLLRIKIVFATASSLVGLFDLLVFGVGNRIRDRRDPWGVSLASKQALSFEPVIHIVPGRAALLLPKSVGEVLNRMNRVEHSGGAFSLQVRIWWIANAMDSLQAIRRQLFRTFVAAVMFPYPLAPSDAEGTA